MVGTPEHLKMNWLLKKLGFRGRAHRGREYRGADFFVRIKPIFGELVSIAYKRQGDTLSLDAERIGKRWEGVSVKIPERVDAARVPQLVADLGTAFRALGDDYLIYRSLGTDTVPETERQAALTELRDMGFEIEVSPDGSQIRQKRREGAPRADAETMRKLAPRIMSLLQAARGKRERFEILARSKEFQPLR